MMKTQVMKTRDPEFFYLLRKVCGFLFLFVLSVYFAQTSSSNDSVNIDQITVNKESGIYVESGTFIYNSDKAEKSAVGKSVIKNHKLTKTIHRVSKKAGSPKKNIANPNHQKLYDPPENRENLSSPSSTKTIFLTNNDYHKKQINLFIHCYLINDFTYSSELPTLSFEKNLMVAYKEFRTRPPPF